MKDYLKEYLDALRVERNLSSMTCEAYKRDLNDYLTFIKSKKTKEIFEITQMHIREYIREFNIEKHIIQEDNDTNHKKMLKKLSNIGNSTRTFPQIWINDEYIGGCDNLKLIIKND